MSSPTTPPDGPSSSGGSGGAWTGPPPRGGFRDEGSRSPHAATPTKPRRPPRTATSILYPKPSRESVLTAAVAVGCVIVVKFAVAFVQLIGNAIDYSPTSYANGFLASPIGLFLGSLVLYPFFYYLAAFVALALFFPLLRQSPLPIVLGRAVAAGIVATIVLAVVGIVTGVRIGITTGDWIAVALYVVFIPLSAGILLTAVLVAGSVAAWLWLGKQGPLSAQEAAGAESRPGPAEASPVPPSVSSKVTPAASDGSRSTRRAEDATSHGAKDAGHPPSTAPRDPESAPPTRDPESAPLTRDPVTDLSRFAPPSASSSASASPPPARAPKAPPGDDDD